VRLSYRLPLTLTLVAGLAAAGAAGASATSHRATATHGVVQAVRSATVVNAHQSSNWFGYNQTLLPKKKFFTQITGDWIVPTATQHTAGESENSSVWIGIGGGCANANCVITDGTLIQTGTEEDVDASGHASYFAWYELIPAPELRVTLPVRPGDRMHASIVKKLGSVFDIVLTNVTTGQTFKTTVPYPSTLGSAEWIAETPLLVTGGGFAALPNLSPVVFDHLTVNGHNPQLSPADEMQLVNGNGQVYGAPSAPQGDGDGFAACAWAQFCAVPGGF
jgi:peptidase A4-like protein